MNKSFWYIHGANASSTSFNRIDEKLHEDTRLAAASVVKVSYNCHEPLEDIVNQLAHKLPKNEEVYLIGHSLGGVLAVATAQQAFEDDLPVKIGGVITLASPMGGSESADVLQWIFPAYHLFKNISTRSRLIQGVQSHSVPVPVLSFITTSGNNPLIHEANDGVVTIASQRALPGAHRIEMPFNHFEVLLSDDVVDHIKNFIINQPVYGDDHLKLA
jgi:predicted alpha/beta hydrolase family esterase